MQPLTKQQKLVYACLRDHAPITVRGMNGLIPVDKVSARLSELAQKGVRIKKYGRNKHREMLYGLEAPLTKRVQHIEIVDGVAVETFKEVSV